jgi:TPR repeat protein
MPASPPPAVAAPEPPPPPAPVAAAAPPPEPAPPAPVAATAVAPAPQPAPPAASPPPADPQEIAGLVARADELLGTGDVVSARLFYQRAAELGSGPAATAVGQTYDPLFLEVARVRGVRGDTQVAAAWYRKAIALGDRQAEIRLRRLEGKPPG